MFNWKMLRFNPGKPHLILCNCRESSDWSVCLVACWCFTWDYNTDIEFVMILLRWVSLLQMPYGWHFQWVNILYFIWFQNQVQLPVGLVQGGLHLKSQLNKCNISKEDDQTIKNFEFSNMFIVDETWMLKFTMHECHAHEKFGESKTCACCACQG